MKPRVHIVSTKVLNEELVRFLEPAGITITNLDFVIKTITVPKHIDSALIDQTIVLTSKTAVEAWMKIAEHLAVEIKKYKVYCLAAGTQTLCVHYGLTIAGVANEASSLADLIMKDKSISSLTFICGNLRRGELPNKLNRSRIKVREIEAYQTQSSSIKIEKSFDGVIFFSPSAIDSFLLLNPIHSAIAFCIGQTTANHARQAGYQHIYVAETHSPESLVKTVANYYKNKTVHA